MSFDVDWDVDKYREDHESDEHWNLRRIFMVRWKNDFEEERLVCLARVFVNVELLGCRYPQQVMQEIARLSHDDNQESEPINTENTCDIIDNSNENSDNVNNVENSENLSTQPFTPTTLSAKTTAPSAKLPTEMSGHLSTPVAKTYRDSRKDKLKRTFVSASDAAEDRARGVKREGGIIVEGPAKKSAKIEFVRPGQANNSDSDSDKNNDDKPQNNCDEQSLQNAEHANNKVENKIPSTETVPNDFLKDYLKEMESMKCLDVRRFNDRMFQTCFGRMVLLVRPWTTKLGNIQSSSQVCGLALTNSYEDGVFTLKLSGQLLARASGPTRVEAKNVAEILAWNRLRESTVCVVMKEQYIAQGAARLTMSDVTGRREEFGTPVETSVATKMMKMMGWKGGGLGADAQGIAEPIKPHLQMVNRAGLGSQSTDIRQLRRAAQSLMQRYIASDTLDVDLVFSSEFSKEERAALHQVAQRAGLASKSYGDTDRFLVVKKKLDPFSLVRAVIEKGGNTPKYQVFIPASLDVQPNTQRKWC